MHARVRDSLSGAALGGLLLTLATVGAVELLSRTVYPIADPAPIFLLTVAYSAFRGGFWGGLGSSILAAGYGLAFYAIPGEPFAYASEDAARLAGLALAGPAVAVMVGYQQWRARQREEELRESEQRLRELDRLKTDFLSTASHELRAPASAVRIAAETLLRGTMDPLAREQCIELIARGADEMNELVEQLLDNSRLEHGLMPIVLRPCDVESEIRFVLDRFATHLRDHKVEIDVPRSVSASADPRAFLRVLGNLVTNAAKYSSPGSRIAVRARAAGDLVLVQVSDEGVGIDPDDINGIFERYERGGADARGIPGSGVGLSIAKQFAEAQGGRVWVDSEPGHGSVFTFALRRTNSLEQPPAVGPEPQRQVIRLD